MSKRILLFIEHYRAEYELQKYRFPERWRWFLHTSLKDQISRKAYNKLVTSEKVIISLMTK